MYTHGISDRARPSPPLHSNPGPKYSHILSIITPLLMTSQMVPKTCKSPAVPLTQATCLPQPTTLMQAAEMHTHTHIDRFKYTHTHNTLMVILVVSLNEQPVLTSVEIYKTFLLKQFLKKMGFSSLVAVIPFSSMDGEGSPS